MQQNVNQQIGEVGDEDFAAMFEASLKERGGEGILKEGEIVKGTVVQVTKDYVDRRHRLQVRRPGPDLASSPAPRGEVTVKAGDRVDVFLESRENDTGLVVLSKEKADKMQGLGRDQRRVRARRARSRAPSRARVKGGLSVTIRGGVKAFLPGSQVDLRPVRNLDKFIGQTFKFKVIKFNKKRGNIVLSRRVLLEKERDELKKPRPSRTSKEGKVVKGVVKNITEYGAFIDLGGIDGLLHITDMSWGRVNHPSRGVPGRRRGHASRSSSSTPRPSASRLGLKQIQEDPWNRADEKYPVGKRVRGKVVSHHRLRRVHRARAGRRRPRPRHRDVAGPSASSTRRRCSRSATRSRRSSSTSTPRPSASRSA